MLTDPRGQSVQIGAVLLFGILVISLALVQAVLVPQANADVEFSHSQTVQGQLQELRTGVLRTAATGSSYPATVDLGVRYPNRMLFVNPGPASGTLRTVDGGPIEVANARPLNTEAADYWNNSGRPRRFDTVAVQYTPSYNVYDDAPTTVLESSVLYNRFEGTNLTVTGQRFVDGRTITLVALDGSLAASSSSSTTVTPRATSPVQRTVAFTEKSSPIEITVPMRLTNAEVATLLDSEFDDPADADEPTKYVQGIDCSNAGVNTPCGELTLTFEPGVTYEVRLGEVGLGSSSQRPDAAYLVDVAGDGTSVPEGGSTQLVVEVRDRYNNPVSGQTLNASVSSPGGTPDASLDSTTKGPTDADGRVAFRFDAPDELNTNDNLQQQEPYTVRVWFGAAGFNQAGRDDRVEFTVYVTEVDGDSN